MTGSKLAWALLAYYAVVTLQGCGGEASDKTTVATTDAPAEETAAPTPVPTPAEIAAVRGSLKFGMSADDARAIEDTLRSEKQDEVKEAFATGIAGGIAGVATEDVGIRDIWSTGRRLEGRRLDGHDSAGIELDYVITFEVGTTTGDAMATAITKVDTEKMSAAVGTELAAVEGLEDVTVESMATPEKPREMDVCEANFNPVGKELNVRGPPDLDALCEAFDGFFLYCPLAEMKKTENPPPDTEAWYENIETMDKQFCSVCGKAFQEVNNAIMEQQDIWWEEDMEKMGDRRSLAATSAKMMSKIKSEARALSAKLRKHAASATTQSMISVPGSKVRVPVFGGRRLEGHDRDFFSTHQSVKLLPPIS
jgi:hypothetical protein